MWVRVRCVEQLWREGISYSSTISPAAQDMTTVSSLIHCTQVTCTCWGSLLALLWFICVISSLAASVAQQVYEYHLIIAFPVTPEAAVYFALLMYTYMYICSWICQRDKLFHFPAADEVGVASSSEVQDLPPAPRPRPPPSGAAPDNRCLVQFMWQPLTQMSYPKVTLLTSFEVCVLLFFVLHFHTIDLEGVVMCGKATHLLWLLVYHG